MVDEERKRRSGVMSRHTLSEEQGKLRVSSDVTANQRSGQLKQLTAILERYGAANESGATRAGLAGSHEERAETTEVPEEHLKDFWKAEIWAYFEDELWNMYLDESDKCASTNEVFERDLKGGVLAGTYEERAATSSRNVFERDLKGITWRTNAATVGGVLAGSYEERAAVSTMSPHKVLERNLKGIARRTSPTELGGFLAGMYEERAAMSTMSPNRIGVSRRTSSATLGGVLVGTHEERAAAGTTCSSNVLECDLKGTVSRMSPAELGGIPDAATSYEHRHSSDLATCPHRQIYGAFKTKRARRNRRNQVSTAPDKKAHARASTAAYYQKKGGTYSLLKKAAQDRERRQKYAKAKGTSVAAPQAQFNGLNGSEQEVSEMLAAMQEQRRRHLEHLPPAQSESVLCRDAHYPADEQSDKDHCSASEAEMLPPSDEEEDSDEEPGARSITEVAQDNEGQGNGSDEDREPDPRYGLDGIARQRLILSSWSSDEEKEEEHTPISDEPRLRGDRRWDLRLSVMFYIRILSAGKKIALGRQSVKQHYLHVNLDPFLDSIPIRLVVALAIPRKRLAAAGLLCLELVGDAVAKATSLHPSMLPTIIRHDSPHSQAQPPPAPVVMLFSATDLHLPTLPALMIHEDLHMKAEPAASATDTEHKSSKVVAFMGAAVAVASQPRSSAPPASSHRARTPSTHRRPTPARDRSLSPLSSIGSEDESEASLGDKITAPTAVCRQNIKKHPEWIENAEQTKKITAYIKKLADSMLDKTRAFTNQNEHKVKQVYRQDGFEEILDKLEKLRWYGIELDTRFDSDKYKDNLCRYVSTQKHDTFGAPPLASHCGRKTTSTDRSRKEGRRCCRKTTSSDMEGEVKMVTMRESGGDEIT
ncbi:hypothetical protein B0H11DRAFT_1917768 [Mycena galericulata]|nr:hypothetical protein B0H11DRAFT_1917768 [Mycena galericulata]